MIRLVAPEDAEELAAVYAANRDFLAPFDPVRPDGFFTHSGQVDRIAEAVRRAAAGEGWTFAIIDEGAIAGTISLNNVIRFSLQSATVGYWVAEARNGRGLATTAVADVVEYAVREASLHRLEAGTLPDNLRSQRVLERNGFERIGLARDYLAIDGVWRDHVLFQKILHP